MSTFTDALIVSPLADGKTWVILKEFSFYSEKVIKNTIITVPVGFQTDFTSTPRILRPFFPKWGKYGNGSVIHDWLYWQQDYTRQQSDQVFLESMEVLNVKKIPRYTIYYSIRAFGFISWYHNQRDKKRQYNRVIENLDIAATQETKRPSITNTLWHVLNQSRL